MTTRYEYKCNACGNDYVEQRSDTELTPFFGACRCGGLHEEVAKVFLYADPEPLQLVQEEPTE